MLNGRACLVIPQQERKAYVEHPAYNNCVDGLYQLLGIDLLKDEIMTYDKNLDHLAKLGLFNCNFNFIVHLLSKDILAHLRHQSGLELDVINKNNVCNYNAFLKLEPRTYLLGEAHMNSSTYATTFHRPSIQLPSSKHH